MKKKKNHPEKTSYIYTSTSWTRGCGFKSHAGQHSIATSKNLSAVNTNTIHIYMKPEQETSICICMPGKIYNICNLYIIENTVTLVPRQNFTEKTNSF